MFALSDSSSLSPLISATTGKKIVMLGEASHGTHEYYTWRTAITKKLIEDHQFSFIAVEGDWPDCYLINRYVKGYKDAGDNIVHLLKRFDRWPTWMWANWEIAALAEWLRDYNKNLPPDKKVGFYGLDVYSLWDSMKTMIAYLEREDERAAQSVKEAIRCFEPYKEDERLYANFSLTEHNCREQVISMLKEIRMRAQYLDGDREAGFNTEQNALIAVNAEKYYRSMIGFNSDSWNIRDMHMMETLERLMRFHGNEGKGIVWEHNTHIGDARATDMAADGMVNIGQLAREKYGVKNVFLVGFGSYKGTVIAGKSWGADMQVMEVPEAITGSIENILHQKCKGGNCYFIFDGDDDEIFTSVKNHRAIGVVYHPLNEKRGNYVPSVMADRYDAFIFLDKSKALHPLHMKPHDDKMPDTYPFGM
jgi:erythromycin esterase-like protein